MDNQWAVPKIRPPMRVALDLDGVVSDFASNFVAYANEVLCTRGRLTSTKPQGMLSLEDWTDCPAVAAKFPDISRDGWYGIFDEYCEDRRFRHQPVLPSGVELLEELLSEGYVVRFFTHRRPENTPEYFDGVPVTMCDGAIDKAAKAAAWGADVFIDDKMENCACAWHANTPLVFLWATRMNKNARERLFDKTFDDIHESPVGVVPSNREDLTPIRVLTAAGGVFARVYELFSDLDHKKHLQMEGELEEVREGLAKPGLGDIARKEMTPHVEDTCEALKEGLKKDVKLTFDSGAQRNDANLKGRYDLLPPHAVDRVARHYEYGVVVQDYDARSWEEGLPLARYLESALRHTFQVLAGDNDEDHAAAAVWNLMGFMETAHRVAKGDLPIDLGKELPPKLLVNLFGIDLGKYLSGNVK